MPIEGATMADSEGKNNNTADASNNDNSQSLRIDLWGILSVMPNDVIAAVQNLKDNDDPPQAREGLADEQ
ncbi:hypothetical protein SAMN06265338_1334 [Rhodoblastus acidophilus]|uniref:Uncharacterized protein n=2 Tax=Rhodoblastus acidophilus TaxID=1074 RepID=A0A212SFA1_RHOAC|nr:hypothetical protein SAMN06265338_1334 [Rhodoblastus acidophilus]